MSIYVKSCNSILARVD